MAIIKEIQTDMGVVAPYNQIIRYEMGADRTVLRIFVAQYYSKEVADNGGRALNTVQVAIPLATLEGDLRDFIYPILQTHYLSPFAQGVSDAPEAPTTTIAVKPNFVYPGPPEEVVSDLPPESIILPEDVVRQLQGGG